MLWQSSSLVTGVVGFLSVNTAGFKSFSRRRWQLLCDTKSALFRAGSMNLVLGMGLRAHFQMKGSAARKVSVDNNTFAIDGTLYKVSFQIIFKITFG